MKKLIFVFMAAMCMISCTTGSTKSSTSVSDSDSVMDTAITDTVDSATVADTTTYLP